MAQHLAHLCRTVEALGLQPVADWLGLEVSRVGSCRGRRILALSCPIVFAVSLLVQAGYLLNEGRDSSFLSL